MTIHFANAEPLRAALIRATEKTHTALHHDPIFACLVEPDLTEQQYRRALTVFAQFYGAVEYARAAASCFSELSLALECEALRRDVGSSQVQAPSFTVQGEADLLGALYVAHGAAFGRNTMRANVTTLLPRAQQSFISLQVPTNRWRKLNATLTAIGQDVYERRRVINGANGAFSLILKLSRLQSRNNAI